MQMPPSVYPPQLKKGKVDITFHILQNGKVEDLHIAVTSDDEALDRAAFGAIAASSPFPPLASDFHCAFLALRFVFYYNEVVQSSQRFEVPQLPCVKTKILLPGETSVAIYPGSIQVMKGASQQFTATVVGEQDSPLIWSVSGKGCSESSCGSISPSGGYTAPSAIPIPATVTITATLRTAKHEAASAVVTIVEPSPSQ
jgi:TonB family protein